MANIKFSAFTQKVAQANVDFLVGYTGADNVRITPAALGDGIYLPLGGGTMVGNIHFNDGINANFGGTAGAWELEIYANVANDAYIAKTATSTGDLIIQNKATDSDIIFSADDGSGGTETYFYLDGSASAGNPYTVFPDNSNLSFGNLAGGDIRIVHNGTDSYFDNNTGDLYFRQEADNKNIIFQADDNSGGLTEYFRIDGLNAINQFSRETFMLDDVKLRFGTSGDLNIYHDGSNSFIDDSGTGGLYIRSNFLVIGKYTGELGILALEDGAVELYYDNGKRLETTATGVKVIDEVSIGTNLVHTGDTDTKLAFGTNNISLITGGATHFVAESDQTTHLYSGNATTLVCDVNQGATFSESVNIGASKKIYLGGSDARMQVYHTGSGGEAIVLTKEGDLKLVNQSHGADIVFKTEGSGGAVVTPLTLDSAGAATFAGSVTGTSAVFNSGITVDGIYIDGAEIDLSSGTLTFDADAYSFLDGDATFAGDIEVENSANGLILESPDGTRYRVTVANGGTLSVAAV